MARIASVSSKPLPRGAVRTPSGSISETPATSGIAEGGVVPRRMYFSIAGVDGMENVKDDEGLRKANLEWCKTRQGTFVDTVHSA